MKTLLKACIGVGLALLAGVAQAQSNHAPYRIGLLPDLNGAARQIFVQGMGRHQLVEGKDFVLFDGALRTRQVPSASRRAAEDIGAVTKLVVNAHPDLIVATSTAYAIAARQEGAGMPIVMWTSGYPVEAGVAESLARPGKNVTGNSIYAGTGMWGKLLELLKEAKPGIQRVAVLWDYVPPAFPRQEIQPAQDELAKAALHLGLQLQVIEVARSDEVAAALSQLSADALLVTSGWGLSQARERVTRFATERRMPVAVDFRWPLSTEPYPLLAYSASQSELLLNAADYAAQILRGAPAGELPINQPKRFELLLNAKTAKALGLELPQSLRLRADEVIE